MWASPLVLIVWWDGGVEQQIALSDFQCSYSNKVLKWEKYMRKVPQLLEYAKGAICAAMSVQVFCGMLSRIAQFADIMLDAKQQIEKVDQLTCDSEFCCSRQQCHA